MKISKRMSALALASIIGLASVSPGAAATGIAREVSYLETGEMVSVEVDTEINKTAILNKLKELFPKRFDFLTEADLQVQRYFYPENPDEDVRVNVMITKRLKDGYYHGDVTFYGDNYQIESFYLDSPNKEGAYYPGAKSKEEIEKIARDFMAKVSSGSGYVLKQVEVESGWGSNQTLTEPVRYQAVFEQRYNGVPILGQERYLSILGNGDIIHYYGPYYGDSVKEKPTFEQKSALISGQDAKEIFLSAIDLELQYQLYSNYSYGQMKPVLSYIPVPSIQGIHASDGTFFNGEAFVKSVEPAKGVRLLVDKPLAVEKKAITEKEARQKVEQLLPNDIDGWTLNVGGVHLDKWSKQEVYQVSYSYERPGQSHGGSISILKDSGEVVHFYTIFPYPLDTNEQKISRDEAQAKAIEAIKTYLPSLAHQVSYPIANPFTHDVYYDRRNVHTFIFPMVKNGIIVSDGQINVEISAEDGSLISLYRPILEDGLAWPNQQQAVSKEKAREDLEEKLEMKLVYAKLPTSDANHYSLMYQPVIGEENNPSYYDAVTGKWTSFKGEVEEVTLPEVEGHWAEAEIRYLMNAKILSSIDGLSANEEITKATALEVVLKSIEIIPETDYGFEERKPTFPHIDKGHPLFSVVERAVDRGILSANEPLDLTEAITREELAAWYIRGLNLGDVAKHEQIFTLPFKDSDEVEKDMVGYVALASAYEIFNGDKEGQFQPKRHVTLAELAVSSFKYGKTASELNMNRYY